MVDADLSDNPVCCLDKLDECFGILMNQVDGSEFHLCRGHFLEYQADWLLEHPLGSTNIREFIDYKESIKGCKPE